MFFHKLTAVKVSLFLLLIILIIERFSMIRLGIFASGKGSNAEVIFNYFKNHPKIQVVLFAGNKADAGIADLAKELKLPFWHFSPKDLKDPTYILQKLGEYRIDWIILAGFLLKIPDYLIDSYPDKIINIHPSLLPSYGGKGMYGQFVHQAVLDAKEKESGISIHLVNGEYDRGRILFQAKCKIEDGEQISELLKKIQKLEHENFPKIIEKTILEST